MSLRMLYLIFSRLCGWLLLLTDSATFLHGWYLRGTLRSSASKDVELLVRHEVAVLRRTAAKPRLDWADTLCLGVIVPTSSWLGERGSSEWAV
jgi:putative transposase